MAGNQAEHGMQDTCVLACERQEIAPEEVLGPIDNDG